MLIGKVGRHAAHLIVHNAKSKKTYKARKLLLFLKSINKTQRRRRTKTLRNKKWLVETKRVRKRLIYT